MCVLRVRRKITFALAALSLWLIPAAATAETLVLGSVNENIRKHLEHFAPLAVYLEEVLAEDGITDVEVSVLPDSDSMALALQSGDVDLYFDSPLVAARVARLSGAEPFLRRWKDGVAEYHAMFVVRADSPFETLDDLQGAVVGFQEPDSTSGFMLPAAMLKTTGLHIRDVSADEHSVDESEVGYIFTGHDRNTVASLARGTIDAGATDPRGLEWLEAARPGEYRVLARSINVPRQIVVRRGDLNLVIAGRVSFVLQDMANSVAGKQTMMLFNETTRFDPFPLGVEATFGPIYERLDQLEQLGVM
ncbi:MAG: phosphate/phosphite/phosphonate ABC transporter substrate-binding protein [Pseudomonadota bacterium]